MLESKSSTLRSKSPGRISTATAAAAGTNTGTTTAAEYPAEHSHTSSHTNLHVDTNLNSNNNSAPNSAPLTAHRSTTNTANPSTTTNTNTNTLSDPSNRTVLRKTTLDNEIFYIETNAISKSESTIYFPRLPRSWMPNGLMLIPYLSEKNAKAHYEIEIHCNIAIKIIHLPESYSRSIAGEWKEHFAG